PDAIVPLPTLEVLAVEQLLGLLLGMNHRTQQAKRKADQIPHDVSSGKAFKFHGTEVHHASTRVQSQAVLQRRRKRRKKRRRRAATEIAKAAKFQTFVTFATFCCINSPPPFPLLP